MTEIVTVFAPGEQKDLFLKTQGGEVGGPHNTHTDLRGEQAMDKVYEQQLKRARGDAAPSGEMKKAGEKGSCCSCHRSFWRCASGA